MATFLADKLYFFQENRHQFILMMGVSALNKHDSGQKFPEVAETERYFSQNIPAALKTLSIIVTGKSRKTKLSIIPLSFRRTQFGKHPIYVPFWHFEGFNQLENNLTRR